MTFPVDQHVDYPHQCDFFVGLDSDGCVIDTMRIKQHEHIQPAIIRHWHLEPLGDVLLECAEFVNMTSVTRGINRLKALLLTFEYFNSHPETIRVGFDNLPTEALRAYCISGLPLGAPSLEAWLKKHPSEALEKVLTWNYAVNDELLHHMRPAPAFQNAVKALELMQNTCDMMVVSQAPRSSLLKEWSMHNLLRFVPVIAGQEAGDKAGQLIAATQDHYPKDKILMIGDATGDKDAAQTAGVLFYPILPNEEELAWQKFNEEAYPKFLSGTYAGDYEAECLEMFSRKLPSTPPWITV